MKYLDNQRCRIVLVALTLVIALCASANAQTYGPLAPATLSCTRSSLSLGFATLPACSESKGDALDRLNYWVSAYCEACSANTLITAPTLVLNIGLQNGACPSAVLWSFNGGVLGSGASAYIFGTLTATSTKARGTIATSEDCNGVPTATGPNGGRLAC